METEDNKENTIDLSQLLALCRKHIWALIGWSIGLAIVAWGIANFAIAPRYTATAQMLVNQKNNNNDPNTAYTTQQANMQMVTTYKDIVTSHKILQGASDRLANPTKVIRKAKPAKYLVRADGKRRLIRKAQPAIIVRSGKSYAISAGELASAITVNTQQQSQVFSIQATANTPDKARVEANAVAESFRDQIPQIMSVNNVTIVAQAQTGSQSFPNTKLFALAGFLIGLVLSLAVIRIREMTNTTVRNDDYLTQDLGLTNLGQIAHFHVSRSFRLENPENEQRSGNHRRRRV